MRRTIVAAVLVGLVAALTTPASARFRFPRMSDVPCRGGHAGPFPCRGVDLRAFVPLAELGDGTASDIAGWADPATKREYALMGGTKGLAIVDVTSATRPVFLGNLHRPDPGFLWQDVEVYRDHAFVVCDIAPCGVQIFDLTRLRGADKPQTWTPDVVYPVMATAHTIDINPRTGMAYLNGIVPGVTGELALLGGQYVVDVSEPKRPLPVTFVPQDGYVHDSHCRIYKGPDADHRGDEICFNVTPGKEGVSIYDMSIKVAPQLIGRATYRSAAYPHQAWLTRDHGHMLVSDESDEGEGRKSRTYIFDVSSLAKPKLIGTYRGRTKAVDHNNYVKGNLVYQSHYAAGLRILDPSDIARGKLKEIAFFDVLPEHDDAKFDGAWSVYPYLPSGNILISGMNQGLFVVAPSRLPR